MNTCMVRRRFGNDEPTIIIELLKILYGTPSLQELDQYLLRLHNTMDCNQPIEVMLHITEEAQMFLIAHPDGYFELRNVNIIRYAMIKLSKCGGPNKKATERW